MRKRVWCAEPWLSSATQEGQPLIVVARQWAERLATPVRGWISDKQDAFGTAIAAEFPGIPPRDCPNHFRRDVAKPVLDMDSRAQVKMRRQVRGVRAIDRWCWRSVGTPRPLSRHARTGHPRQTTCR